MLKFDFIKAGLSILWTLSSMMLTAQRTPPAPYTGTPKISYVRSWEATAPEKDPYALIARPVRDVKQVTQYLDGLGRPIQTVMKRGSLNSYNKNNTPGFTPVVADMVSSVEYDDFGRETYSYLPFAANSFGGNTSITDGNLKMNPFQQQAEFYRSDNPQSPVTGQGETYFYGKTVYEPSPLNRIAAVYSPGNNWMGTEATEMTDCFQWFNPATNSYIGYCEPFNRNLKSNYWVNTTLDQVRIWNVNEGTGDNMATFESPSTYPAGELFKYSSLDEHHKQVIEFKDRAGRTILNKVQLTAVRDLGEGNGHTGWLCTYYIYDDLGRLRGVIQPEGVRLSQQSYAWSLPTSLLNEQCFRYEYDDKGKPIVKKAPGAAKVFMIYDAWDRLVLSQSGIQRENNQYSFFKYDGLNRPVITGLFTSAATLASLRADAISNTTYQFEEFSSPGADATGYTMRCWPTTDLLVHTVSYYDDYSWLATQGNPFGSNRSTTDDDKFLSASDLIYPFPQPLTQTTRTTGLVTGTKTRVLGTSQFLYSISYFNEMEQVVQTISQKISGSTATITYQQSFSGELLVSYEWIQNSTSGMTQSHGVKTVHEYDELNRLVATKKQIITNNGIGNTSEKLIHRNQYDAVGHLKQTLISPDYAGSGLEKQVFEYNIRSWMLGMNRDYAKNTYNNNYFGFDLGYDKNMNGLINGQTYSNPQFNGNLEGLVWKSKGDSKIRKYDFAYDAANRLMSADFNQYANGSFNKSENVDFSVTNLTYDYNGNIKSMNKKGMKIGASPMIDQLTYSYFPESNRLKAVLDEANDPNTLLGDFRTLSSHPQSASKTLTNLANITDYDYDTDGNLRLDNNKAISSIQYNDLNLPTLITVAGKGTIAYTYDATGEKLKKEVTPTGQSTKTTVYINGEIYENNILQVLAMEEGRIRYRTSDNSFQFDYFIRDHLGNVRMVLTEEEKQDIYPAATLEGSTSNTNSPVSFESTFYSIQTANIELKQNVTGITNYPNNNGIPSVYPGGNDGNANYANNSDKLYKLNSTSLKTGLGITLKVMSGDKIDIFGNSYYFQQNQGGGAANSNLQVLDILNGFLGGPTGQVAAGAHGGVSGTQLNTMPGVTNLIAGLLSDQTTESNQNELVPKAYINYLFFDEQFNCVGKGFSKVGDMGVVKNTHHAELQNLEAPANGYVYVYCSNESPVNVFFDNLQVVHTRGRILEETHYYPYGLAMNGISSKALTYGQSSRNQFKFNGGSEIIEDFDISLYETTFRNYDAQIGRFAQQDPLADNFEGWSPYVFAYDNPMNVNDPFGLEGGKFNTWKDVIQEILKQFENGDLKEGMYYQTRTGGVEFMTGTFTINKAQRQLILQPDPEWYGEDEYDEDGSGENAMLVVHNKRTTYIEDQYMPYEESGWDYVPGVGSARKAYDHFKKGRWGWGIFHTIMGASDLFFVSSVVKGVAKGGVKALTKNYKHWTDWRKFYGQKGWAQARQPLHHWLFRRNGAKVGTSFAWKSKNQMFNLVRVPRVGGLSSSQVHTLIHGGRVGDLTWPIYMRLFYGTPTWAKSGIISGGGRIGSELIEE